jgi:methylenetetrahydrofolate dehydrogenase (NADP+)/methenyltetrahydrofolate cyclohydrolase
MLLDGRSLARTIRRELAARVEALKQRGIAPALRILLIGDHAPSRVYVRNKERAAAEAGIDCRIEHLPSDATLGVALSAVTNWNSDPSVHGVIVQLPVPGHLDADTLVGAVSPRKDVDGLSPASLAALASGRPTFLPATPSGIIELLIRNGIALPGKKVVIIGRGELVGRPLSQMLLLRGERGDATVTVCHSRTRDLGVECRSADIVVAATGMAGLVTADMVKEGVVVIDAGTSERDGRLVGDVDFESVAPKAAAITPVPGGVGPMTVAMLLANVVLAAERSQAVADVH